MLHYEMRGEGPKRPALLIHAWGCDHTFLAPQIDYLSATRRLIAVDLWGHGSTAFPASPGKLSDLADGIAAFCKSLSFNDFLVVGHSMGGAVGLELATRHPQLVKGIVALDGTWLPQLELVETARAIISELGTSWLEPKNALKAATDWFFLEGEEKAREEFERSLGATNEEALRWALNAHVVEYDATEPLRLGRCPIAYVASSRATGDIDRIQQLRNDTLVDRIEFAGHFAPITQPQAVNQSLEAVLARMGI